MMPAAKNPPRLSTRLAAYKSKPPGQRRMAKRGAWTFSTDGVTCRAEDHKSIIHISARDKLEFRRKSFWGRDKNQRRNSYPAAQDCWIWQPAFSLSAGYPESVNCRRDRKRRDRKSKKERFAVVRIILKVPHFLRNAEILNLSLCVVSTLVQTLLGRS